MSIYESVVQGRRDFREAFRREREKSMRYGDALDHIARFNEAFADVIEINERGQAVGAALAGALAAYARRVLNDGPAIYPTEPTDEQANVPEVAETEK